jgi:hypothetical protein
MAAYQITYSYIDSPMASDEYGSSHFTFNVNMRPEDLNPTVRQKISERRISRTALAEEFKLVTSRGFVQRIVIDEANSARCDGNYRDGSWIHSDLNCEDKMIYKTVTVPSDFITVKVDPAQFE